MRTRGDSVFAPWLVGRIVPSVGMAALGTSSEGPVPRCHKEALGHGHRAGGLAQRLGLVGPLPGELGLGAAEVAAAGGLAVDRPAQVEVLDDPRGGQREVPADQLGDLVVGDLAGALGVDVDAHGLGDADGVGELHLAAVGQAGGDDVLGDVAGHVGGRAVDLRGVLAAEGAAAVAAAAAVGVDDDLPPGQARVAVRAADDELAGRVDVVDDLRRRSGPAAAPAG